MTRHNTKEEVITYLLQQFPQLTIELTLSGHITHIDQDTVYSFIISDDEEYEAQFYKHIFPQEDLAENIYFLIVVGKINNKDFKHVNYFYYTQQQIDKAQENAEQLYDLLK